MGFYHRLAALFQALALLLNSTAAHLLVNIMSIGNEFPSGEITLGGEDPLKSPIKLIS